LITDGLATTMPCFAVDITLEDMAGRLESGHEYIQRKNSKMLGHFIDDGVWLNAAYVMFENN